MNKKQYKEKRAELMNAATGFVGSRESSRGGSENGRGERTR